MMPECSKVFHRRGARSFRLQNSRGQQSSSSMDPGQFSSQRASQILVEFAAKCHKLDTEAAIVTSFAERR
eukprot:6189936-Pleurochrysis_carterae.AAC.1